MRYIETDLLQQYKQAGRKSLKKKEKRVWMRSGADPARKKRSEVICRISKKLLLNL